MPNCDVAEIHRVAERVIAGCADSPKCCGDDQARVIRLVAHRVAHEAVYGATGQPLNLPVFGSPGAGKSFLIDKLRNLFDMIGMSETIAFAAFMGTAALVISGETLNHLADVPFGDGAWDGAQIDIASKAGNLQQRHRLLRFVVIDEISTVSPRLLWQSSENFKVAKLCNDPWGGLNVMLVGDFYQLPPPAGHSLEIDPAAVDPTHQTAIAGIELFRDCATHFVELPGQRRADGPWHDVLQHCRFGTYPSSSHHVLSERVVKGPNDPRLQHPKFRDALHIVYSNDVRTQINTQKVLEFAARTNQRIEWAVARDDCDAGVDDLAADRREWLTYPDSRCKQLPGMLPLVQGLPLILTDHVDRGLGLLRGTRVTCVRWAYHHKEEFVAPTDHRCLQYIPRYVIVRKEGATWCLPHLRPGEFPVQVDSGSRGSRRRWNAGSERNPVYVTRTQLPLAPGYAITCHGAQGTTLDAAVVELNLPPGANPIAAYIAISRVRRPEDLLILSQFKADVFRRGTPPERLALLEHFRQLPDAY